MLDKNIDKLPQLFLNGDLPIDKLTTREHSIEDINQACNDMLEKKLGRGIISFL